MTDSGLEGERGATDESGGETVLTVMVPRTPPSDLFPNKARTLHYLRKADISRPLRELGKWEAVRVAMLVRQSDGGPIFRGPVRVKVRVFWEKGRRMPDVSALGHAVKAFEDGLTDAGIWRDDSQVIEACYGQERDADGKGYTLFEIEAV